MTIASRLKWFLDVNRVDYEVLHPSDDAPAPSERTVKSELFADGRGMVMVVLPAQSRTRLPALQALVGRSLHRARERELRDVFFDCERRAVPPVGAAYGVETVLDESLPSEGDVYFPAGDGGDWIHMQADAFAGLLADASHGRVSGASPRR